MKPPGDLSGRQLANELRRRWDYREVHQTGSHIILLVEGAERQTLTIPAQVQLRLGTVKAVLELVADQKGISIEILLESILRM